MDIKCLDWTRVVGDEGVSYLCRNAVKIFGRIDGYKIHEEDLNVFVTIKENIINIGEFIEFRHYVMGVRGCNIYYPIVIVNQDKHIKDLLINITKEINNIIANIPHNWMFVKASMDLPFCRTINKREGFYRCNGDVMVYFRDVIHNRTMGYHVVPITKFDIKVVLEGHGIIWQLEDDDTLRLLSKEVNLPERFMKDLEMHAEIATKIFKVMVDKSCDIIRGVVDGLYRYNGLKKLYP